MPRGTPGWKCTCAHCGVKGHATRMCPRKKQCPRCGSTSHTTKNCPEMKEDGIKAARRILFEVKSGPRNRGLLESPDPPKPRERVKFGRRDELAHLRNK